MEIIEDRGVNLISYQKRRLIIIFHWVELMKQIILNSQNRYLKGHPSNCTCKVQFVH